MNNDIFVTCENHCQITSLVTKKSLFMLTHALFFISLLAMHRRYQSCTEPIDTVSFNHNELRTWPFLTLTLTFVADSKLNQNNVAGFLILIRNFVQCHRDNQDSLVRTQAISTLGALLQRVSVAQTLLSVHNWNNNKIIFLYSWSISSNQVTI